jgi:septal ring factor EnvC (AmiA/AmiB activator)
VSQDRSLVGIKQAARGLCLRRESVYRLIRQGALDAERVDDVLYVTRDSFDRRQQEMVTRSQDRSHTVTEQLALAEQTISTLEARLDLLDSNRRKAGQLAREIRSPFRRWRSRRRETERRLERAATALEMLAPDPRPSEPV